MNFEIVRTNDFVARLTTEHSASSYGIPVLVCEGITEDWYAACGPADIICITGDFVITAIEVVRGQLKGRASRSKFSREQIAAMEAFCSLFLLMSDTMAALEE